jgi:hypothetical protein
MRSFSLGLFLAAQAAVFGAGPSAQLASDTLASIPAWFEPAPPNATGVQYVSHGSQGTLCLDARGASLALNGADALLRLSFLKGNPAPQIEPLNALGSSSNYFKGSRANWRTGVPHYARVRYASVYPGIDLVHYSRGKSLEFDFLVQAGADPNQIRLRWTGSNAVRLEDGAVVVKSGAAEVRLKAPEAYQDIDGKRVAVASRYELSRGGEVRLALGEYDRAKPLVVDPVMDFMAYVGGDRTDIINAIALDKDGALWVTGSSNSNVTIPAGTTAYQATVKGERDAFLAKIVPVSGAQSLVFWTFLGGTSTDSAAAITFDSEGAVWIAGTTNSANFPMAGNAFQTTPGGLNDAFVARFDPNATGAAMLVYSSYYGGTGNDIATAMTVTPGGQIVVTGYTSSGELPKAVTGVYQPSNRGGLDGFIFFVDRTLASAQALTYSTFFGGNGTDMPNAVAYDPSGYLILAGFTMSDDLPAAGNPYRAIPASRGDGFISKFDFSKTGFDILQYTTYVGGSGLDSIQAMSIDPDGSVWCTGYTMSTDYPIVGDVNRSVLAGSADVFLTHLDINKPPDQALLYSTYIGGNSSDVAYGILPVGPGQFYLTGYTYSQDYITINSIFPSENAGAGVSAFLTLIDTNQAGLASIVSSGRFGGAGVDVATSIVQDAAGNIYLGGYTNSPNLPATDGSVKANGGGLTTGFVLRVRTSVP